jgi:hypothetical protein
MKIRGCVIILGLMCGLVSFGATATRAGDINVPSIASLGCAPLPSANVVSNGVVTVSVADELCPTGRRFSAGAEGAVYVYSLSFLSTTIPGQELGQITMSGGNLAYIWDQPFGLVIGSTVGLTPAEVSGLTGANIKSSWHNVLSLDISNFQAGDELTFYLTGLTGYKLTGVGGMEISTSEGSLSAPVLVPTPEPVSTLLFGIGLLVTAFITRRKLVY